MNRLKKKFIERFSVAIDIAAFVVNNHNSSNCQFSFDSFGALLIELLQKTEKGRDRRTPTRDERILASVVLLLV